VTSVGELCNNNHGLIQTGPFGSQLHADDYKDQGTPIVNPTHLSINTIVEENIPLIGQEDVERLARHCLSEGDILISRRGDFSRYSYISSKQRGWVCGTGCLVIRLNNSIVDNYFLSISIGSKSVQKYLADNAVGSIMPNINTKILERMPVALPLSIEEQQYIASVSRVCDAKIAALQKEITLHEEVFRALLDELMTGRISTLPLVEQLEKGTLAHGQRTSDGTGTTH
jgi:type I restriction enzyme S subunit